MLYYRIIIVESRVRRSPSRSAFKDLEFVT